MLCSSKFYFSILLTFQLLLVNSSDGQGLTAILSQARLSPTKSSSLVSVFDDGHHGQGQDQDPAYLFGGMRDKYSQIEEGSLTTTMTTTATETSSSTSTTFMTLIPTLDPEIFNCVGLGDFVHPYPGRCDKFIVCRGDHSFQFNCPEPFLFHPINLRCQWPDLVEC